MTKAGLKPKTSGFESIFPLLLPNFSYHFTHIILRIMPWLLMVFVEFDLDFKSINKTLLSTHTDTLSLEPKFISGNLEIQSSLLSKILAGVFSHLTLTILPQP